MNFKKARIIGMVISVCLIVYLIVITITTNFIIKDDLEEYPSGLIKDQTNGSKEDQIKKSISDNSNYGLKKNDVAPDFKLKNLSGETVQLSDYRGKTILLNFWASWCSPCIKEMPYMQKYYEQYGNQSDIEIIAVNMTKVERGGTEKIESFIEEHKLTFPVLLDDKAGTIMDLYKVRAFPTTYIINKEGVITDKENLPLDDQLIKELIR
ncbi:MAG: TlpA disulfide reductase family protein [Lysinibacillus sp.]